MNAGILLESMYALSFALAMALLVAPGGASAGEPAAVQPMPDSNQAARPLRLKAYAVAEPNASDTLPLSPGDSVFLYDGELYYRARANGRDFFVSRAEIMKRSDSLVVYQTLRLTPAAQTAGDSVVTKAERRRCVAVNKNGTRCKRQALTGSDRCWQHKK